jgi:proteasome lid subunit RPN8/RPN11
MPEKVKLKKRKRIKVLKKKGGSPPSKPKLETESEEKAIPDGEGQEIKIEEHEIIEEEPVEETTEEIQEEPVEEMSVTLNYMALNKILRHGLRFSSPNKSREEWIECMGFLIGNVNGEKVKVNDAIPMVHGNLVEVEFQIEHYARADEINQTLTDDNWVVGWYHTHPGHGLFLSRVDKINHAGYQSMNPKAIALVFDPTLFSDEAQFKKYVKIFRLENPHLREESDFSEIAQIKLLHPIDDVIRAIFEAAELTSKEYPIILEYGEDYKKPEIITVTAEESEDMGEEIEEMRELIANMKNEVKLLRKQLQKHMTITNEAIGELKKGEEVRPAKKSSFVTVCEFCGYDSIMPGDKTCGNCGMKL